MVLQLQALDKFSSIKESDLNNSKCKGLALGILGAMTENSTQHYATIATIAVVASAAILPYI